MKVPAAIETAYVRNKIAIKRVEKSIDFNLSIIIGKMLNPNFRVYKSKLKLLIFKFYPNRFKCFLRDVDETVIFEKNQ